MNRADTSSRGMSGWRRGGRRPRSMTRASLSVLLTHRRRDMSAPIPITHILITGATGVGVGVGAGGSRRLIRDEALLPLPACGERVGVRGNPHECARGEPPHPPGFAGATSPRKRGEVIFSADTEFIAI